MTHSFQRRRPGPSRRITPLLAAATLLYSSCADRSGPATVLMTWTVDATPMLAIAGDDSLGQPRIGNAEGVIRLHDGTVVIADRGLSAIRWFDRTGTLVRSYGREGDGPDEFRYLHQLLRCGDSLFVHDITRAEPWQVLTLDGTPVRRFAIESPQQEAAYRSTCGANGHFLHMGWERLNDPSIEPGRYRGTAPFWLGDATGRATAPLGDLPGSERLILPRGTRPHPLGREPVLAVGRTRAYVGTADSVTVRTFSLDGAPLAVVAFDTGDLRTTPADIERYKYRDTVGRTDARKTAAERDWETFRFPPTVPAYDAMLVDALDHLWLRRTPRSIGAPADWLVFDPDGLPVARVPLPDALQVHDIGAEYIAGIRLDEADGGQTIEVYTLRRTPDASSNGSALAPRRSP
jgi:hypothetical protein